MKNYNHRPFRTYPQIMFDNGVSKLVGVKLKEAGVTKAMVIYDKGIESTGIADRLIGYIEDEGIAVVKCNQVQADPPDTSVEMIGESAREEEIDGIVAIGGGSALDTAKGVKVLRSNPGKLSTYFDLTIKLNPGKYFIAIPTTAGTGSESSAGGMILDTASGGKKAVGGPGALVDLALIDPELTMSLPKYLTVTTGFDAASHCIDGILSDKSNLFTQYQAIAGIRLFNESVVVLAEDLKNLEARGKMFGASTIGGLIIGAAGCSLIHSFAHALGAKYGVAHGNAISIFIQPVLEAVATAVPDKIKMIAEALSIEFDDNESVEGIAERSGQHLTDIAKACELSMITDIVDTREEAYGIIALAQADMMTNNSPIELTDAVAKNIVNRAFEIAE